MGRQLPALSPITGRSLVKGGLALFSIASPTDRLQFLLADILAGRTPLFVDSGTSALRIAIENSLALTGKSVVAIPAFGCYDLVTAPLGAGADVFFYDLDPKRLGPGAGTVSSLLDRDDIAAIVLVHQFGIPAYHDLSGLAERCRAQGTTLIEDVAQGFGAKQQGRALGTFGDLSVFSFGRGKGVTGGAGGLLSCSWDVDVPLANAAGGFSTLIKSAAQAALSRPWLYGIPASLPALRLGETIYHPPQPPAEMSGVSVSMLSENVERSRKEVFFRKRNVRLMTKGFESGVEAGPVLGSTDSEPSYLRLPVLTAEGVDRGLYESAGVLGSYPIPLTTLPAAREIMLENQPSVPGAEHLASRLVTFPTHSLVGMEEAMKLAELVRQVSSAS